MQENLPLPTFHTWRSVIVIWLSNSSITFLNLFYYGMFHFCIKKCFIRFQDKSTQDHCATSNALTIPRTASKKSHPKYFPAKSAIMANTEVTHTLLHEKVLLTWFKFMILCSRKFPECSNTLEQKKNISKLRACRIIKASLKLEGINPFTSNAPALEQKLQILQKYKKSLTDLGISD